MRLKYSSWLYALGCVWNGTMDSAPGMRLRLMRGAFVPSADSVPPSRLCSGITRLDSASDGSLVW